MSGAPGGATAPVQAPVGGPVASATSGSGILGAPPDGDSIGPQSGAAKSDGVMGAPADPDLMTDTSCLVPFLLYGDGFSQNAHGTDVINIDISSGTAFNGNFLLRGLYNTYYPDIQIRIVYRNSSGTVQRYRDLKYDEIPPAGTQFSVSLDPVGFGDFLEIYVSPRRKGEKGSPDSSSCTPIPLANFSETWTEAPGEDFGKSLWLMGRFKMFTPLKKMDTGRPPIEAPDFRTTP